MEAASQARIEVEVICAPIYAQMTKKEARSTEVPLHGMEGPWERPNQDLDQISACDGPARLVVIPAVQGVLDRQKEREKIRERVVCPCSHDPQQFAPGGGEIDRVYGHG
ncbi:unnamed protein product [Pylaiella littoralis]